MLVFEAIVVLCLALPAMANDKLTLIKQIPNDQESLAVKMELVLEMLTELKDKVAHQEMENSELKEIVQRQEVKISRLERIIDDYGGSNRMEPVAKEGKAPLLRTCEEIRSVDPGSVSGTYWIDPDGVGAGDAPISVHCDMATGATLISHDSESLTQADRCLDPGCYSRPIAYNATMRQMAALTRLSRSCRQFLRFSCLVVPLEFNNVQQAWWNDRIGDPQFYWAGSNDTVHTCQCGIDGNCVLPDLKCNCDSLAATELLDSGYITNKNALPVTKLNFGRTLLETSYGRHALGKFECSGRALFSGKPKSCEDLWIIGHSLSGYYEVQGTKEIRSVYCDFSNLPGEQGFQTDVGSVDIKSSPVYFHVQQNADYNTSGTTIPYDTELLNVGGGMNLTSGIFTAPRAGLYQFHFSGLKLASTGYIRVDLYHNGAFVARTYGSTLNGHLVLSLPSLLKLNVNDQVRLVYDGTAGLHGYSYTNFIGILIQEDLNLA